MVIFLHLEMEDDGRRSSKRAGLFRRVFSGSRSSPSDHRRKHSSSDGSPLLPLRERRPLRSVPLSAPHYRVEPEILVSEFVEKETKYLGTVRDLPCDFDASDRVSLLKIVDEQRTLDLLPCMLTYKHDIILTFSVHNIKLLWRDGEKLIERIQTHKIAAVGYVRDDSQHLVFIKYASELNAKMCNLAVLCFDTKAAAEEVCSLAQQVFQLVYTDSTIDFLDKSIMDGAITPKNHSYSTDDSDKKDTVTVSSREYAPYNLGVDTFSLSSTSRNPNPESNGLSRQHPLWGGGSQTHIQKQNVEALAEVPAGTSFTFPQPGRPQRHHRRSGSSDSANNSSHVTAVSTNTITSPVTSSQTFPVQPQLQDYVIVLKEQLTKGEMERFASLLRQFRTGGLAINEFSSQLLEMYTERRKSLLLGMRHFIPGTEDLNFFNEFLKENDVKDVPNVAEVTSTSWWSQPPGSPRRTFSETEESSASTSVNTGQVTALSLSSSGSERASASVVSNDDSGEWKDVLGNIGRLGVYASTDSSAGADLDSCHRAVNGTPPKHDSMTLLPPLVHETPISASLTPPVAAVPEGFRDSFDKGDVDPDISIKKMEESPVKKSSKERKERAKKLSKAERTKLQKQLSSSTDALTDQDSDDLTLTLSSEKTHKSKKDKRKSSVTKPTSDTGQPGTEDTVEASAGAKSQHSKAQKEHRKKKKHKESPTFDL